MKFENININTILVSVVGIFFCVVVLIIALWIHRRKNLKQAEKQTVVPLPQETDWGKDLTDRESLQVEQLAKALYDDMKGLTFYHDSKVWQGLNASSDRVFVAVCNQFTQINGNGETLKQWLNDESWEGNLRQLFKAIIERYDNLIGK